MNRPTPPYDGNGRNYRPTVRPTPSGGKLTDDGLLVVFPEPLPTSEVERRLVALAVRSRRRRDSYIDRRDARRAARTRRFRDWSRDSFFGSVFTLTACGVMLAIVLAAIWLLIVTVSA